MNTTPRLPCLRQIGKLGMLLLATSLLTACDNRKTVEKLNVPAPEALPSAPTHYEEPTESYTYEWDGKDSTYVPPMFPGGVNGMATYLKRNLKYPPEALRKRREGRVYVGYIIGCDGEIADAWVQEGVTPELDRAALQVIKEMPRWTPATVNGRPVRIKYTQPIAFRLPPKPKEPVFSSETLDGEKVYTWVKEAPRYPEGLDALSERTTIYLPGTDSEGRRELVYVQFIIDKEGYVRRPKILRGLDSHTNEEVLRTLSVLPRWEPGKVDGRPVNCLYTMPIICKGEIQAE